jgi:hypothetical protein
MQLNGTRLVRLGTVHAAGLAALAFATPALATDDAPPPAPPVVASAVPTSGALDDMGLRPVSAGHADPSPLDKEIPGNTHPSAPATAQLESVRQGWSQVISPSHAQKSPERASTSEPRRSAVAATSHERQYHPRQVQYHRLPSTKSRPRAPEPRTASFSFGEATGITRSSSPTWSPNGSRNDSWNCELDSEDSWLPDLPAGDGEGVECAADPTSDDAAAPSDDMTADDAAVAAGCAEAEAQYQPDETQYQPPILSVCEALEDSVVPISEPAPSAQSSSATSASTSVVSPTTEPGAAPVAPDTEPTQSGADDIPAPDLVPPPVSPRSATTKVSSSRSVGRPTRSRLAGAGGPVQTERVIAARAPLLSPRIPARPRPARAPSPRPQTFAHPGRVEAAAPQRLLRASSHGGALGGWLLLVLPLSFVLALGLLLPAATIAGRSLRARVRSKGLSDHRGGTKRSAGIRYRD